MTLEELNTKYKGRPLDMSKWHFSGMSTMGSLALAANDVELNDGQFYDFRATIHMDGSAKPSDIIRHHDYGKFERLSSVSVRLNGESEPLEDNAGTFIAAIDTMIAPAFGLKPTTDTKVFIARNDVCPWDYPRCKEATREACDLAWEAIKRELVHFTARKFNLPEPKNLSENPRDYPFAPPLMANYRTHYKLNNLLAYRMEFEIFFCGAGRKNPSWERSKAWVNLRNAMLDEMFDRVGIDLPPAAHALIYMYNGRKPTTWTRLLPKSTRRCVALSATGDQPANADLRWPKFPLDLNDLEEARAKFLTDEGWRDIYAAAPDGARRRLDLSFWYSAIGKSKTKQDASIYNQYQDYRPALESCMDIESLNFLTKALGDMGFTSAAKHYQTLVKERSNPLSMYMSYDQFFLHVRKQGDYKEHRFNETKKKALTDSFISGLAKSEDPLKDYSEDILATAKIREVRTYPTTGWLYLRLAVRFLNKDGAWNDAMPFQIAALLDFNRELKGYTFIESRMCIEFNPDGFGDKPTKAQRQKREELQKHRESDKSHT